MTETERAEMLEQSKQREAEIERELNRKFAETIEQLIEWVENYQPADFNIEQARQKARQTPEMQKLEAEIKELEMINGIFEGRHIK